MTRVVGLQRSGWVNGTSWERVAAVRVRACACACVCVGGGVPELAILASAASTQARIASLFVASTRCRTYTMPSISSAPPLVPLLPFAVGVKALGFGLDMGLAFALGWKAPYVPTAGAFFSETSSP